MQPDNENTAPTRPDSDSDSPMSVLERRLAEIARARQAAGEPGAEEPKTPQPAPAAPASPAAAADSASPSADTPAPAEVGMGVPSAADLPASVSPAELPTTAPARPDVAADASPSAQPATPSAIPSAVNAEAANDITEHSDQSAPPAIDPDAAPGTAGTEPVPVVAPESTSETTPAATDEPAPAAKEQATTTAEASAAATPAAETATPAADLAPATPAEDLSPAQVRAEEHYGSEGPGAVATASETGATFAPAASTAEPTGVPASAETGANASGSSEDQAHDEEEEYVPESQAPDFATLDVAAQGSYILSLLRRPDARQNRKQIHDLHRQYEQHLNTERTAARQKFVQEGNDAEAFEYAGPEGHAELSKAMQDYREARVRDAKQEDEQRDKNLAHKQELLNQLRQLVESAETKDSSGKIKALQADWKATGPVPQQQAQELWNSYHALLDIYYNNRGLFFEMKELDRRRNLEAKEGLIQRAEGLTQQQSINKALTELRQLHEEWKTIGPVPNEQREPLWQRFLAASEQVHNRKRTFLDARSAQENANLTRKQELLAQILPYGEFKTERVNEWRAKTDELQALKEQWDAAGLVPRAQAETMNKQFWGAYKGFFQHKNQFFKALDEEKSANLKRKIELCEQAEAALENPNWEEGREVVIRVQKEWKGIGRVPEKQSDKIWHRFRTACDSFFDRKQQETRQREQHIQQLSADQTALLDRIAAQVAGLSVDNPGTQEGLKELVSEWTEFCAQPQPGRRGSGAQAEEKFLALAGKYIGQIPGLSYAEQEDQIFRLEVQRLKSNPDAQQLLSRKEQNLRREINELENDTATLQTNLDFFGRSKNAGQLREEYQGRIEETKKRIEALKRQLRTVRS